MRRLSLSLLAVLSACRPLAPAPAPVPDAARILADIAFLADDKLEGRGTGTAGNDTAAAYLARRHAALGLRPIVADSSYLQHFQARGAELAHTGRTDGLPTQNVVALVPGRDATLQHQYIVIGAHFDHLGRSTSGALDPQRGDAIRNGADDNASGTAAALELARLFSLRPARRSIVIAHFSGEELGLLGSQWFVEHAPVPLDSIDAMINFDMVGRLRNDKLIVYGVATASELPAILSAANIAPALVVSAQGDGFGPSDHSSFYAKGIPVLHFFTDLHDDYHSATDDTDKINSVGEASVVAFAERVIRDIADRPARLTPVRVAAPAPTMSSRTGSSVYLGSIPDMSASDTPGLRLTGVRAGSPADSGGLRAGDVIVEFGGALVKDIYTYTEALYAHKVGDRVKISFMRDGVRAETTVVLGKRGG